MVLILGESDNKWVAKIVPVREDDKMVGVYFLKQHPRWPGGRKFIKESCTLHNVHWACIIKELEGNWMSNGIWESKDAL